MKKSAIIATLAIASLPFSAEAKTATLYSPDKSIKVIIEDGTASVPVISVAHEEMQILDKSEIGLKIRDRKSGMSIKKVKKTVSIKETIDAPFHHTPNFISECNELSADLGEGITLTLRAFNDGVAYRFSSSKAPVVVEDEIAVYRFSGNPDTYLSFSTNDKNPMAMAFQNYYTKAPLHSTSDKLAFLPAAADFGGGLKAVILESDLEAYPGMFLTADSISGTMTGKFAKYPAATDFYPWRKQQYVTSTENFIAKTDNKRDFPWRIISITDDDRKMPVSNLVYALASPSRVKDTSWIKPGKVAWDWWNDWGLRGVDFKAGINTETYKYYIDFASKNGIEYVVLDEGWYVPQSGDMLTVIPDINLKELISYGKERGVGIVLWTVFNVLDSQLEEACSKYADMGIKGFKVDFLDRDDQDGVEMVYRIADATAKHNLMLDLHGIYKPTGLNRTYPNVVNFEAVFGMEEMKWSPESVDMPQYDVTYPYLRMMCGPVDYTPGAMRNAQKADWKAVYYNPMSQGTRAHQVATYVVYDSPFTMLCDSPSLYEKDPECTFFIASLPTVFGHTEVLDGKMGEYIVTMRSFGEKWYVGGMTNWTARSYELDFSFLPDGKTYTATILKDGVNAAKQGDDYTISKILVNKSSKEKIQLAPGGGFAVIIEP